MAEFPDPDRCHPLAEDCRRCPALVESRNRIVWGNGPTPPDEAAFLVVGEAPAAGDPDADRWRGGNHTGAAYTSRHAGRRIRDLLDASGIGADRCFFTNAVKCHPSGNRDPTAAELDRCRQHLEAEIDLTDPAAIVPTGSHATASVLEPTDIDLDGFLEAVLSVVRPGGLEAPVVPLLHPSYQDVWIDRLGYTPAGYRDAVGTVLRGLR